MHVLPRTQAAALALLMFGAGAAGAAADSAATLALAMARAGHTSLQLRATLSADGPGPSNDGIGTGAVTARILLRVGADAQSRVLRLDTRVGADAQSVLLAIANDGSVRARLLDGTPYDVSAPLIDGVLAPIDFSGAWWRWSGQSIVGSDRVLDRECTVLESWRPAVRGDGASSIRRVRSCVAEGVETPLRVQLFGADANALRWIEALRLQRLDDGRLAAASVRLHRSQGAPLRLDAYAVDTARHWDPLALAQP